jgi:hypothetical protein
VPVPNGYVHLHRIDSLVRQTDNSSGLWPATQTQSQNVAEIL